MKRTLLAPAALTLLISAIGLARAGELPEDVWSGKHGGNPSITVGQNGVSITLPSEAVTDAGGGSVTEITQNFLQKYAPGICSDVFDFQSPHKRLQVQVTLQERVDLGIPFLHFYRVSQTHTAVTFDYTPSRTVKCVTPAPLTS